MDNEDLKNQQEQMELQEKELKQRAEENKKVVLALAKEGKLPQPRALTRKERKEIDAKDLNLFRIKKDDQRDFASVRDELWDYILDVVFKDFNFDDTPNNVASWFADYVFALTFRDKLSEKN